jgi:translation elongation factor EF-G
MSDARPRILEPVMGVEITVPTEFQGTVIGNVNRRKAGRGEVTHRHVVLRVLACCAERHASRIRGVLGMYEGCTRGVLRVY